MIKALNPPRSWNWVDRDVLLALHDESLAEHSGAIGLRDEELLALALARPQNLALDDRLDYAELAAAYGADLAKNDAFVDGNKRISFLAMGLFLCANGYRLHAQQSDAKQMMHALATGQSNEAALAQWIRDNSHPV
jgi:death on curing protein